MDAAAVILFSLASTSALLCVALAVAWRRFGRQVHAALWALAYGLSAANWASNLIRIWLMPTNESLVFISGLCSVASFALIALGFRQRAGMRMRTDAIAIAGTVTVAFVGVASFTARGIDTERWLVLFFCAGMLLTGVHALSRGPDRTKREAGGAAFWALLIFAAYIVGLGALAMLGPAMGMNGTSELYRVLMLLGVPTGMFGVGIFSMFLLASDLAEGMRRLAASDPLTGVLNRRGLEQAAAPLLAYCQRNGRALSVVVADIDRFKAINDRFGHAAGDAVLQRFGEVAAGSIRTGDLFGRLGGEEFAFVLPDALGREAVEAMERLRREMAAASTFLAPPDGITASFGVATMESRQDTLADLLARADQALYRSKLDGRDRVTLSGAEPARRMPPARSAEAPLRAIG